MQNLLNRDAVALLGRPQLTPDGVIYYKHLSVFANALNAGGDTLFILLMDQLAELGWIQPDSIVISGNSEKLYVPSVIKTAEGMALKVSDDVIIPMALYTDPSGAVSSYITRKEMPAEPTSADYLMMSVSGTVSTGNTQEVMGLHSVYTGAKTNPLLPAPQAAIGWRLTTYFQGSKGDNTAHCANVQKALAQVAAGQIPQELAEGGGGFAKKTKDLDPGLYAVLTLSENLKGKLGPVYSGDVQLILGWNDLGLPLTSDSTLEDFLAAWDGKIVRNVKVNSTMPAGKAAQGAYQMYLAYPCVERYMLISPFQGVKDGYTFAETKGFAMAPTSTVSEMIAAAGITATSMIQSANKNASPSLPGFVRDPYAPVQAAGTPIMAPSMMGSAEPLPAVLPAAAPLPTPVMPQALPTMVTPLPTMPPAAPTMAMPTAIDVPATEAFDLPFAADLPGAATTPMSAVAPPMPAPVPAPPAPVAEVAPVVPVAPLPVVPSAPVVPVAAAPLPVAPAPVMPLPVDVPAAPVAASSTVSKAKTRATVAL